MNCPVCSNKLSVKTVSGINLDVCDNGCGGIWFDQFEFKKFDEKNEPDVENSLHLYVTTKPNRTSDELLTCPKCKDMKMMRNFSSAKRLVTIDTCPNCAGTWLDSGEMSAIRDEFTTEADRKKAAEAVFSEMFDAKLNELHKISKEKADKAEKLKKAVSMLSLMNIFKKK